MKRLSDIVLLQYIALTLMRGLGPVGQNCLLNLLSGADSCFFLKESELWEQFPEDQVVKRYLKILIRERDNKELISRANQIVRDAKKEKISIITKEHEQYPERFRNIPDMPIVIYIKGNLQVNRYKRSTGIVGPRRCSDTDKLKAIELAERTIESGSLIISGMAKGIDSYAHTAAIKRNGYTVAVIGNGADICYPCEHRSLYEAIAKEGCIMSEYPPGVLPRPFMFPARNRIIAALSDNLYVINPGRNSGTRSTVEACRKYGHKVIYV